MDQPISPRISDAALKKNSVIRGLVVLSTKLTTLHINKPAADLAKHLRRKEMPSTTDQVLPYLWLEVGEQIREAMERVEATHDGRAIHVRRRISEGDRSIDLSGFGLVAGNDPQHSRIVLITEEHCSEQLAPTDLLRYRFLFAHIRAAGENDGDEGPGGDSRSG